MSTILSDQEKALIAERRKVFPDQSGFFLFAYGSLMWRPGFIFCRAEPARLIGYHRSFCITSTHYRGSADWPGLVLGLDRGGACNGRLYEVAKEHAEEAADYLHAREMVTGIYDPRWITAITRNGEKVRALTYVVDRTHRQYAGKLPIEDIIRHIGKAEGIAGSNRDYLMNTLCHLRDMNIVDPLLEEIGARLEQINAA